MDATTLPILGVVFVATFIRSTFGFGEALVAVPLLALFIPVEVAAPVAVLLSITIAAIVVVQDWRKIHMRSAAWLLGPTLAATPLGVLLLTRAPEVAVKALLGVVIVAFAAGSLLRREPPRLERDSRAWLLGCGFVAGLLGGAYGMNGPPLVVYGAMRRWSPQHFRATLQGYFLPASLAALAGFWLAGAWVPAVTRAYLVSLPVALPTILLGRLANRRLRGEGFLAWVYAGLLAVGAALLAQALRHVG